MAKIELKAGDKITMFRISSMAVCFRYEYIVVGSFVSLATNKNYLTVKEKGKRKAINVYPGNDDLLFHGHDIGLKADSDGGSFAGSSTFNIVADSEQVVKHAIDALAVIPITDDQKSKIVFLTKGYSMDDLMAKEPLYKEEENV